MFVGGLFLILLGIVYGSVFAGIPYPDPTPEMTANYSFHINVSEIIVFLGLSALFLGVVGGAAQFKLNKLGKTRKSE